MFSRLMQMWEDYGFEVLVVLSLVVIVIVCILRIGKKGTWSSGYSLLLPKRGSKMRFPSSPQDSKGEVECRRVLRQIFNRPFDKIRPDFLQNAVTGNNLEIDCFCPELRLGVEYNGVQHYKYVPYFHKTRDAFRNQQYRDYMKRDLCRKNGINLIEVPHTVSITEIGPYLVRELNRLGYLKG